MSTAAVLICTFLSCCGVLAAAPVTADDTTSLRYVHWLRPPAEEGWSIVLFWEPWCRACNDALPGVVDLCAPYGDSMQVVVLTAESVATAQRLADDLPAQCAFGSDADGAAFGALAASALPHSVVLDGTGRARWSGHPAALTAGCLDSTVRTIPRPSGAKNSAVPIELNSGESDLYAAWASVNIPESTDTALLSGGLFSRSFFALYADTALTVHFRRSEKAGVRDLVEYLLFPFVNSHDSMSVIAALHVFSGHTPARTRILGTPPFSFLTYSLDRTSMYVAPTLRNIAVLGALRQAFALRQTDTTERRRVWRIEWAVKESDWRRSTLRADTTDSCHGMECVRRTNKGMQWSGRGVPFSRLAHALESMFGEPVECAPDLSEGLYDLAFSRNNTSSFQAVRTELEAAYGIRFVPVRETISVTVFQFPSIAETSGHQQQRRNNTRR